MWDNEPFLQQPTVIFTVEYTMDTQVQLAAVGKLPCTKHEWYSQTSGGPLVGGTANGTVYVAKICSQWLAWLTIEVANRPLREKRWSSTTDI